MTSLAYRATIGSYVGLVAGYAGYNSFYLYNSYYSYKDTCDEYVVLMLEGNLTDWKANNTAGANDEMINWLQEDINARVGNCKTKKVGLIVGLTITPVIISVLILGCVIQTKLQRDRP